MDTDRHEPSAAERQAAAAAATADEQPSPDAATGPDPDPAEPGPCRDCARRGDAVLAMVALSVAAVIALMAVDLLTGGQLSALVFGGRADDAGD